MAAPEITLEANGQKFGLYLADGVNSVQESSAEESTFNVRFSRGKKKYGKDPFLNLAEFRDWTGGRGGKNFDDDESSFNDGLGWTLSSGLVVPPPRWYIAQGLRTENRHLPGNGVTWKKLLSSNRYIYTTFTTTSSYAAANIWLYVRRIGSPGSLTVELCTISGTVPDVASKTVTKTIDDITDYIDVFESFSHASPLTMSASSTYCIVVSGSANDSVDNHWEVGVDADGVGGYVSADRLTWTAGNFRLYYRVTAANASKQYTFQTMNSTVYAVTKPATGNSEFFAFDNTSSFAAAGGTTGLGVVTGRPLVSSGYMYFPQGASTNIRRWDGSTTWADDGSNKATLLQLTYDPTNGPQVAKSLSTTVNIAAASTSALSFGSNIPCGDSTYPITNLVFHNGKLHVCKQDEVGSIYGTTYTVLESNYRFTPSSRNGVAACSYSGLLYISWLNTVLEMYGSTATDVGQGWRGDGLPGNRMGYASCILGINAWRFVSFDAGATGYSSVGIFNGLTWHEIYRAPYGHRIRDLWWQHVDGGHSRLFIDIDYDVVYIEFPKDVANPTKDSTHKYAHSFYIVTPTFDDGAARLPKYLKAITASTTNAGTSDVANVHFEMDYQTDADVGIDGAEYWYKLGEIYQSPEQTLPLLHGNIRAVRFRIRGYTDTPTVPPQLDALTLDGFTRTPARTVWNMRIKIAESGGEKKKASALLKFLQEASTMAEDILVSSTIPELNGRHVICTRPRVQRSALNKITGGWAGTMTISLMDMSE